MIIEQMTCRVKISTLFFKLNNCEQNMNTIKMPAEKPKTIVRHQMSKNNIRRKDTTMRGIYNYTMSFILVILHNCNGKLRRINGIRTTEAV